jgi:hypothetical protein
LLARATSGEQWRIEHDGTRVRAIRSGARTGWIDGPIYAVPLEGAFVAFAMRRYRGEMAFRGSA